MKDGVLLVAPVLPADVVATAQILLDSKLLGALVTRSVLNPTLARILRRSRRLRSVAERPAAPVTRPYLSVSMWADVVDSLSRWRKRSSTQATDSSFAVVDRRARKKLSKETAAVFAREDCCRATFTRARELGVTTIYQLPTSYWRAVKELMDRELRQFPDVCGAARPDDTTAPGRTERKEEELRLSDRVLCPSTFVRETLKQYGDNGRPIETIPFGVGPKSERKVPQMSKPVFLYVGNVTMRKGVHRLLMAWRHLRAYRTHELRLVGTMHLNKRFLSGFEGMFTHVPRVSRDELDRHYQSARALVFNSMADGFGNVITEAMAHGVPVIASRNSGGPDVIEHGTEGLLITYGDDEQLVGALESALSNPVEWERMGHAAWSRASSLTWEQYGDRLVAWLRGFLPPGAKLRNETHQMA